MRQITICSHITESNVNHLLSPSLPPPSQIKKYHWSNMIISRMYLSYFKIIKAQRPKKARLVVFLWSRFKIYKTQLKNAWENHLLHAAPVCKCSFSCKTNALLFVCVAPMFRKSIFCWSGIWTVCWEKSPALSIRYTFLSSQLPSYTLCTAPTE